ncbi:MAG: hypothetical protein IKN04_12620 [Clostridia bacterium]|nr:hypothetical protein [Clostridia bacterium]
MKRLCCMLLALCFLCCAAVPGIAEAYGEDWTLFESRFGFTLWYPEDQLDLWTDDWLEETAECFCPWDDQSGVAELVCRGSRYSAMMWDDYTRISDDELDADFGLPFEVTAYTDGETIAEQWIVSAPDADYVFIIEYEVGDPQGWAPLFHSVLETLEFPGQSAGNADFRVDFYQGGAAGMQFTDMVVDEDADPIVLIPLREMREFALEYLDWDFDAMTPTVAMTLYAAAYLAPGNNLRVSCYFEDIMPNLRVRYTDAEGEAQCFYLFQSGRDGSLMLLTESEL